MISRWDESGPYIVWVNNGLEGWAPRSYDTLREAINDDSGFGGEKVITKRVEYQIVEC